ncbi:MAG: enoyl-CoA hydratase/isomerase family protein [Candidatus Thermoplasmatota archaeon]|jgi:2-(1,2-epoxy-1,2-dihydrophenyl)acetyl-CoA isomerase|nr:enoyl-CoA hydratase/isomerase family protein [Candidatus Thermoplasmatota archaeon]MEC7976866.1 enoyl-CoA hydratase/isomerase family protein [Candidatus Thermoplasmatota archaeon]MEC8446628.1 enoyl-CoA hydratase/isomerase family protein [Candidatus Thermoplasmatota archaeon]
MTIIIENKDSIRTIVLNRPEKLNSVNLEMAIELNQAVKNAANDKSVQCLVITGNGRAFSSGGDVDEMGDYLPKAGDLFYDLTEQIHSIFSTILRMEKPVINSLNGVVAGGSLGFALAGDYRIASESAMILSAHFKRGFVPAGGATYILPRLIGLGKTQALFFGGKTLNSKEMLEWGLVHEVVSDEQLKQRTMEMAKEIAAGPKTALAETKKLLLDSDSLSLDEELRREREKNRVSGNSGDAVEGIKAFLEKREPKFE